MPRRTETDSHYGIIPRATVSHFKIKIKFLVKVPYWQQTSLTHRGRFFVRLGGLRMTVFRERLTSDKN